VVKGCGRDAQGPPFEAPCTHNFFWRHWAGRGALFLFFLATWSGLAASAIMGARGDLAHSLCFFFLFYFIPPSTFSHNFSNTWSYLIYWLWWSLFFHTLNESFYSIFSHDFSSTWSYLIYWLWWSLFFHTLNESFYSIFSLDFSSTWSFFIDHDDL
jgi:hypothetical protein